MIPSQALGECCNFSCVLGWDHWILNKMPKKKKHSKKVIGWKSLFEILEFYKLPYERK